MSLSEVYRDRYYNPGYVYIAGSLSKRVLKIGVTINIGRQQAYLRNRKYGGIGDWVLLYYVYVDMGGKVEHDARHLLAQYRQITWYRKDGSSQRGREIVKCSLSRALEALLGDDWFPYGMKRNYKPLDTFLRYHYEQGLSKRRFKPEDLFLPETLDD